MDAGFRAHLSSFTRTTATAPSPFVARLRKFLRTRRVSAVAQVGTDRIIEFRFSDGQYRLFLEFYAAGNIVLTDGELRILALQRNVNEGAEHERLRLGLEYNLSLRQNYEGVPPLTKERVRHGLEKAVARQKDDAAAGKKRKVKQGDALRKAIAVSITEFPPMLIDHAFKVEGFDSTAPPEEVLKDDGQLDKLLAVLQTAGRVVEEITSAKVAKGYILAVKDQRKVDGELEGSERLLYDDYHPFRPKQFEDDPKITFLEFDTFGKTVDEFYSSIEGQKLESRLQEREDQAKQKLDKVKQEHEKRIGGLQQVQELNIRKAQAIEANLERVTEATNAVNGLIAQGMDWVDIGKLIEMEQNRGNPVAQMIKLPLKLHENTATILLAEEAAEDLDGSEDDETASEPSDSEDEDRKTKTSKAKQEEKRLSIDIDLALTSWANASQYYDQKRSAAVKEEKTLLASTKAIKSTEQKIAAELKKGLKQEKDILRPVRKQYWFEKFIYFISSDGYLVLGGRDSPQTEILYRRHLKKGDVYVHADLPGAVSVIIKNNPATQDAPIPPSTLSQAGSLTVSTSNAWDSKAIMSAWWVNANQVSKTTPTGEVLTTGGFVIGGKKNFLPPSQLVLGFAAVFQITEESKARHSKHRRQHSVGDIEQRIESLNITGENEDAEDTAPESDSREEQGSPREDTVVDKKQDSNPGEGKKSEHVASAKDDHVRSHEPLAESEHDSDDDGYQPSAPTNPLQSSFKNKPIESPIEAENGQHIEDGIDNPESSVPHKSEDVEEEVPAIENDDPIEKPTGKRHVSARERRLLRKGRDASAMPGQTGGGSLSDAETESVAPSVVASTTATASGQKQLPRGKRAKQKRAAAKYAGQDEEDRALAMEILGSRTGQKAAEEVAEAQRKKEAEEAAQKQRRREQHQRAQTTARAAEAQRLRNLETAEEQDEDAARTEPINLDTFVGRPLPGDELIAAIPVCAPWTALSTYKYKVKLQPGPQKKGKAVKDILMRWEGAFKDPRNVDNDAQDKEKIWPKERDLISAWKDVEVMGVVPVRSVRVMISGGGSSSAKGAKTNKGRGGTGREKRR